jgi:hypothetical protein
MAFPHRYYLKHFFSIFPNGPTVIRSKVKGAENVRPRSAIQSKLVNFYTVLVGFAQEVMGKPGLEWNLPV